MKFLYHLAVVLLLTLSFSAKAQLTVHPMIFAGYEYQNQSFGEVGARFLFLKNDNVLYRISGSGLLGSVNDKFVIIPKIQGDILFNFNENTDLQHSYYFLTGAEVTTKYIVPKAGISLFGIIDFTGGYAFKIGNNRINNKILKGLNLNITINLPLAVFD